jgi:hypothetical protein
VCVGGVGWGGGLRIESCRLISVRSPLERPAF